MSDSPEMPDEADTIVDPVPDAMTIHQIAERSGVPPRRIRHYIAKGVLPPPVGRGRASHYTSTHLQLLQAIESYREGNLGLDEIRERLGDVAIPSPSPEAPTGSSWHRWTVIPGVEIHADASLSADRQHMVRVLLGIARQLMTGDGQIDPRFSEDER